MTYNTPNQTYDPFEDDSFSDEDNNNTSSEDEIDIILHGTPEQRRKLQLHHSKQFQERERRQEHQSEKLDVHSSSEDEFEKEMNAELIQQVKVLEDSRGKHALDGSTALQPSVTAQSSDKTNGTAQMQTDAAQDQFYDEIYFDSDEDEDTAETKPSRKQKHAVISNDELLYDPNMDDEDQKWVDRQRQRHRGQMAGVTRGKKLKMPNSDALLDCPACMTTLCLDCQRHETYKHQYRAMFVMNCIVDKSERLQCPEQAPKKKKHKKKVSQGANSSSSDTPASSDMFHPVRCTECNTVVGVIDHDEVYHFFNILASHT